MSCKNCLSFVVPMMLTIVFLDATCGPEISPWIAYMVPVALASRYCGLATGTAYAVLAGLLLCAAARYSGHPYSSGTFFVFAAFSQMLMLLVLAALMRRLSVLERTLRDALQRQALPPFSAG